MKLSHYFIISVTLIHSAVNIINGQQTSSECGRHREAWHLINDEERALYINGFKQLSRDDKLAAFTLAHQNSAEHSNSAFLPWHRYFIWELETQIRDLGGEYACFGLPYWDWTSDIDQHEYDIANYFILNSGLGGDGDDCNGNGVGGNFAPNQYTPSDPWRSCLTREACDNGCNWGSPTSSGIMLGINRYAGYGRGDRGYRDNLETDSHDWAHTMIGGHMSWLDYSTDDPIFYLLHSFTDLQYTLWQDCYDYEQVNDDDITRKIYGGVSDLDDELDFGKLADMSWSDISSNPVTIRDMHSNEIWSVSYDKGDFFERARVEDNGVCVDNINSGLFKDITRRRRLGNDNNMKSEYGQYSSDIFDRLHKKMEARLEVNDSDDEPLNKTNININLYAKWAKMDCEYLSMEDTCSRPKYFDDCSDMERSINDGYKGHNDINITLDELLIKVSDYPCMVETRNKLYNWTKSIGNLYGLCRGKYDRFCDKSFYHEQGEDKCLAKINKKSTNHINTTLDAQ